MTISLRKVSGYALAGPSAKPVVRAIVGYVMTSPWRLIPKEVTGVQGVLSLINTLVDKTFTESDLSLSQPTIYSTPGQTNTSLIVTAHSSSGYRGGVELFYNRLPLSQSTVGLTKPIIGSETTIHELIPKINDLSGYGFTEDDFVDGSIDDGITLVAAESSYFFVPGTQLILG